MKIQCEITQASKGVPLMYCIKESRCLYIGETQVPPIQRWGQHMQNGGTFSRKISKIRGEIIPYGSLVHFMGISLLSIQKIKKEMQRTASQFVESYVHRKCNAKKGKFIESIILISDISRTTPDLYQLKDFPWIEEYSENIFEIVVQWVNNHLQ